jgi:hypothetical protein
MAHESDEAKAGKKGGVALSMGFFAGGLGAGLAGYTIQRVALFLYTGWPIEPSYFGRILVAIGVALLALGLRSALRIKKAGLLIVVVLVAGADIALDAHFKALKAATLARELAAGSAIAQATVERVNVGVGRRSNSMRRPFAILSYQVGGEKYRQLIWIQDGSGLVKGGTASVRYSPRNPRIAELAR